MIKPNLKSLMICKKYFFIFYDSKEPLANQTLSRGIPVFFIAMYAIASSYLFAFWTKHDRKFVKRFYKCLLQKIPFMKRSIKVESEPHGFGGVMDEDDVKNMTWKRKMTINNHSKGNSKIIFI